ncbi:hypothetical protein HKX23_16710 [Sulfitobacter sp. KE29]|uniref:hypothetical protein n=1 Tax=Roseobacteraceae TaxID=2854170 RepID=UPI001140BFFC|nr:MULTISPECIES: hypothetical protein [Roseobacteraceae]MDF3419992.1 hypothetical protein [Sulfitobacter sp. Ks38]MDF3427482.1 hypothetical protein [Sulfitobacter sp. KE29]MDF3431101.1 hypothetical protein [Sulfitobacter sp. S46]MDF3445841.1 hypothetical protein [Sulfitobacter sp. KE31]MDF3549693.1 hypothetical protein [Sulfitobacter sp. KE28]
MTGHNHYPWCTCGWCVGGGNRNGGGANAAPVIKPLRPAYSEYEKHQATQTLKGYGATSYSRCFVNPNASCPVCGQPVYFYANENGSRVFFDELGKPWAKHPCTDNGRPASGSVRARPSRRPVAEIKDILSAEQKIDQRILPVGRKKRRDSWKLAVVVEVHFADFGMEVHVEDLSSQNHQKYCFFIYCDQPLLVEGDLVSRRKETFSFLHPQSLEDTTVVNGDRLVDFEALEKDIDPSIIPGDVSEILPSERRHFGSGSGGTAKVSGTLRSVLEDFAKKGIVGPKLVSHYLNETGRVTADGSPWTPRLAFFLIALSGVSQEKPVRQKKRTAGSKPQKARKPQPHARAKKRPRSSGTLSGNSVSQSAKKTHKPRSEPAARLSTDVDEWARMLSRLGRVSRKDDDG